MNLGQAGLKSCSTGVEVVAQGLGRGLGWTEVLPHDPTPPRTF